MKLALNQFKGIAPKISPRHLPEGAAQVAVNVEAFGAQLRPLRDMTPTSPAVTMATDTHTIYKFGQTETAENLYWIGWDKDHDIVRSQITGDGTREWTFWTGGDYPVATYDTLAHLSPAGNLRLGMPDPKWKLTGTVGEPQYCEIDGVRANDKRTEADCIAAGICKIDGVTDATKTTEAACTAAGGTWTPGTWITGAKQSPAKVTLDSTTLSKINSVFGLELSTNQGSNYKTVYPSGGGAPKVYVTSTQLDSMFYTYGLRVSDDNEKTWAQASLGEGVTRFAEIILSADEIYQFQYQTTLAVSFTGATTVNIPAGPLTSAQAVVEALSSQAGNLVYATLWGSGVYVRSVSLQSGSILRLEWASNAYRQAHTTSLAESQNYFINAINSAKINGVQLATASVTATDQITVTCARAGADVTLVVRWGAADSEKLSKTGTAADTSGLVAAINAIPTDANYTGATAKMSGDSMVIESVLTGKDATLRVRWGEGSTSYLSSTGVTSSLGVLETRVYTYTWVLKEADMEWESAPYSEEDMASFDVYADGSVTLGGFETEPVLAVHGWGPSNTNGTRNGTLHQRIYRSVNGTYLYVDEIDVTIGSNTSGTYFDNKRSDQLGEACPSILWTKPPWNMVGLTNLPNGMMAGFYGRQVYFCDPYHPHAWPDAYSQSVDYPIVALARMDTTLVVLTTGNPYFIQGSSPDMAVMVKSDLEQACVSKRSVVSFGGAVLYAAPDGMMLVSSSGSDILTKDLLTREEWQRFIPSSIHAYGHDNKYIAFHTTTTDERGNAVSGFIIDMVSKQFIRHNLPAIAGYHDLRGDTLYVLKSTGALCKWDEGSYVTNGLWRSRLFTLPQITGFSCCQVEAESYPVGCRVYRDGVKVVTGLTNDSVTSRDPWRLEAKQGRDWQIELDAKSEIFNVVIGQSMSELAES